MQPRLNAHAVAPALYQAMLGLETAVRDAGLETSLFDLVKIRASQINGCAYCLHMHTSDARAAGEWEERIYLLDAWHESSMFTDRERAALAWTEALTRVAETHAPDDDYRALSAHFSDKEIAALTFLITTINAWNRIAIAFRVRHPNEDRVTDERHPAVARV